MDFVIFIVKIVVYNFSLGIVVLCFGVILVLFMMNFVCFDLFFDIIFIYDIVVMVSFEVLEKV